MKKVLGFTGKIFKSLGIMILAFVLLGIGQMGIGVPVANLIRRIPNDAIRFGTFYVEFIGIWVAVLVFCLIFKSFRKMLPKLGTREEGNNLKTALLIGLPMGLGLNLLCAVFALLHGDIALSFSGFNVLMIIYFIVVIMIQSGAEELVCRWFVYEKLREYFPKWPAVAIIVNALFFSALHLGNTGVTNLGLLNIVLVGWLYALTVYYFKSIWAAIVAHASWNFCQNILLGLPNSGNVSEYSVFTLDAAKATDSFAYSVSFGIEGTIVANVALALCCIAVIYFGRKKNAKEN